MTKRTSHLLVGFFVRCVFICDILIFLFFLNHINFIFLPEFAVSQILAQNILSEWMITIFIKILTSADSCEVIVYVLIY